MGHAGAELEGAEVAGVRYTGWGVQGWGGRGWAWAGVELAGGGGVAEVRHLQGWGWRNCSGYQILEGERC